MNKNKKKDKNNKNSRKKFLIRAIKLGKIIGPKTAPNPWVGAVVVETGKVIGEGFHMGAGTHHAEVVAIQKAKKKKENLSNSELFVSLQPCDFWGRTPPCLELIKKEKIKKVFYSVEDKKVKEKIGEKIEIEGGEKSLLPYIVREEEMRPYVILKMAQTLDGKIADKNGKSKYISKLKITHKLRALSNFVIIGKNTFLIDNPELTVREFKPKYLKFGINPHPVKVILSRSKEVFEKIRESKILKGNNVIIFTTAELNEEEIKNLPKNVSFIKKEGEIKIPDVLKDLYNLGAIVVLVEGGGEIAFQFLKNDLVDEFWIIISPKILGGKNAKTSVEGDGFTLSSPSIPKKIITKKIKEEILIRCLMKRDIEWDI